MDDRSSARVNWWRWLAWIITLLALAFVIRWLVQLDRSIWQNLRHLHPDRLIGSLLIFQVWFLMRFAAWEMIVKRHGSDAQRHQTLRTWTLSELARYVPGNLWSVAAKYRGSVSAGAAPTAALQALAIEALGQLSGAGLTAVLFYDARHLWWIAMTVIIIFPVFVPAALSLMSRWKRWGQVPTVSITESLGLLLWYSLVWSIFGLATAMVYWSFSHVPSVTLLWLLGINVLAWFIGYISIVTPMGLGIREVAFVRLSTGVLPATLASLVALITRLWFVVSELLFLMLVLLWHAIKRHY